MLSTMIKTLQETFCLRRVTNKVLDNTLIETCTLSATQPIFGCTFNMAKDKPPKPKGIPNKHLHARTTFLYQAATYLTLRTSIKGTESGVKVVLPSEAEQLQQPSPLALQLGADLHTVSRKAQLRLSVDLKRSMCKRCNSVLIPGRTATQAIENQSKGGKKPWADVLVVSCTRCGSQKRLPVGAKRQPKKRDRALAPATVTANDMGGVESTTPAVHTATEQTCSLG